MTGNHPPPPPQELNGQPLKVSLYYPTSVNGLHLEKTCNLVQVKLLCCQKKWNGSKYLTLCRVAL